MFMEIYAPDWGDIYVGWNGIGSWTGLVDRADVRAFALYVLEQTDSADPLIVQIAIIEDAEDRSVITDTLAGLVHSTACDIDRSSRRWITALLRQELTCLKTRDAVDGLAGLTEFWIECGYPCCSPHEIQGRDVNVPPAEYYTDENFSRLLDKHHKWLRTEVARLGGSLEGV